MGKRSRSGSREAPPAAPPPSAGPRDFPWGWTIAALCLVTCAAYFPALSGPFLFDDQSLEPFLQSPPPVGLLLRRLARLITNLSFLAEVRLTGLDPKSLHVTNLLLHLLNGWLVWRILETLLARRGALGVSGRLAAAAGAGLFLLHPLATESAAYISSRSELLSALFAYLAFLLFLRAPSGQQMPWGRALAVTALVALGAVSKEPAVAVAGVFIVFDLLDGETLSLQPLLRRWKLYAPMLAAAGLVGFRLYSILSREGTAGASARHAPLDYLLTQFEVIWHYFRLILLPFGQNLDHAYPVVKAPGSIGAWLGLAALAAVLALAWRFRRQYPLALFGLLFLLILLAPTSSIIPIDDAMAERRLYLGFPGVAMIAAEFLRRLRPSLPAIAALGAVLLLLAGLTWRRAGLYTAAVPMWEDSVAANPRNSRAWFHLGFAYYAEGRCADAARAYEKGAALNPEPDYTLLVDWATALECEGKLGDAEAKLREAARLERNSHGTAILGRVLAKKGDLDRALETLNEAVQIAPNNADALVYRGNVRLLRNEPAEALADYEAALRLQPGDSAALKGRQSALRALGRSR